MSQIVVEIYYDISFLDWIYYLFVIVAMSNERRTDEA